MPDRTPKVPDAELDVLVTLNRDGPETVAGLVRRLSRTRPMTHGSVSTLLGRLERKGLVARRKADAGKAFVFSATERAGSALRGTVHRLVTRILGGDRMMMVASLLESAPLDAGEIDRLEKLVGELGTRPARKPR